MNDNELAALLKANKGQLTDEEMALVMKDNPFLLKSAPDFKTLGIVDLQKNAKNLPMMQSLINRARDNGYYLELISLTILTLDFYLRLHYTAKTGKSFVPKEEFFNIVKRTNEEAGLDNNLFALLTDFNTIRNRCIHRFVLGEITYDEIGSELKKYSRIVDDTIAFVITSLPDTTLEN